MLRALDSHLDLVSARSHNLRQLQRQHPDLDLANMSAEDLRQLDEQAWVSERLEDIPEDLQREQLALADEWRTWDEDLTAGRISQAEYDELVRQQEQGSIPRPIAAWLELEHMRRYTSEQAYLKTV